MIIIIISVLVRFLIYTISIQSQPAEGNPEDTRNCVQYNYLFIHDLAWQRVMYICYDCQ